MDIPAGVRGGNRSQLASISMISGMEGKGGGGRESRVRSRKIRKISLGCQIPGKRPLKGKRMCEASISIWNE